MINIEDLQATLDFMFYLTFRIYFIYSESYYAQLYRHFALGISSLT